MSTQRSSDVVETYYEKALPAGIGGLVAIGVGILLAFVYPGALVGLGYVLLLAGVAGIIFAIVNLSKARHVPVAKVVCPYCDYSNTFTETPTEDVRCMSCNRMIPIQDGKPMKVHQVRCGFCNTLNYYSDKSVGLICEDCDRVIPIANDNPGSASKSFSTYAQHDDTQVYELVLVAYGHKTEEVIDCLQHMLALNRNQVKDMLGSLPVTLLTGIPRKKAEMLAAQLAVHEAAAEFRPVS